MAEYTKLPRWHSEDPLVVHKRRSWKPHALWALFLSISIALNLALLFRQIANTAIERPPHGRYARTSPLDTVWNRFYWHSRWDSTNRTDSDQLWDAIKPSHGFVAIDRERAAADGWPESMYLPSDHSKGVYLLEAYHQLHCLRIVRQTFNEAVDGRPYTYNPHHAQHCFDALRQSAVCNADSTPLYTFGDKTAGDGQIHKCRSWEQLRDWASENTACYRDSVEDIPLGEHFGYCDDGNDGISVDEFRIR